MNETNKIIPPSVGRQVHFHFASSDVSLIAGWNDASNNTYAATVAFVHSDRLVNLSVIDAGGYTYGMQSIPLCQPGDERPLGNWCEWPPHLAAMSRPPGRVPTLQSAGEPPTLNQVAHPAIAATQQLDNDGNAIRDAFDNTPRCYGGTGKAAEGRSLALGEEGTVSGDGSGQPAPAIPQD